MTLLNRLRAPLRALAASLFLSLALVRPAAATDWTDIWWAIPEVGWGVNFVQSDQFIFATFYLHDANLQPVWYTGQMTRNATTEVWSGGLYRTTGSYFGAPWNGSQTDTQQVGSVSFTPSTSYAGTLTYNVGAVNVTKQITRLTLTTIPLGGLYRGGIASYVTNCNNPANNGVARIFVDVQATQTSGNALSLDFFLNGKDSGGGSCTLAGNAVQEGTLYRIPGGSYVCGSAFSGTANVTDIKATAQGIEGQWSANVGDGCVENGYFSAVLY